MMPMTWFYTGLVSLLMVSSFYTGYRFEAGRFLAFKTKVEAEANDAKRKLDEAIKQHEETSKQISHDYQTELVELHGYYSRLLDGGPGRSGVPTVSRTTKGADGAATCKPVPVVTKECAETALKLKELQHWVEQIRR